MLELSVGGFVVCEFEDVARLAFERVADEFEGAEADGLCLARLEDRKVGGCDVDSFCQLAQRHLTLGHDYIEIDYDCH